MGNNEKRTTNERKRQSRFTMKKKSDAILGEKFCLCNFIGIASVVFALLYLWAPAGMTHSQQALCGAGASFAMLNCYANKNEDISDLNVLPNCDGKLNPIATENNGEIRKLHNELCKESAAKAAEAKRQAELDELNEKKMLDEAERKRKAELEHQQRLAQAAAQQQTAFELNRAKLQAQARQRTLRLVAATNAGKAGNSGTGAVAGATTLTDTPTGESDPVELAVASELPAPATPVSNAATGLRCMTWEERGQEPCRGPPGGTGPCTPCMHFGNHLRRCGNPDCKYIREPPQNPHDYNPADDDKFPVDVPEILSISAKKSEFELNRNPLSHGDFVAWPGKCSAWNFKDYHGGSPVSHYPGAPSAEAALQLNDSALTELSNLTILDKKKHLLLAMGYNHRCTNHPNHEDVHGAPFGNTGYLGVHQSVIDHFQSKGFTVSVMNTYNGQTGGYNGNEAMQKYNELAKDPNNFVAILCHTTC